MIRIEVHGMGNLSELGQSEFPLKGKILALIREKSEYMLSRLSIIRCNDTSIRDDGTSEQFLRIYCSNTNDFDSLVHTLRPLGLDIETIKLEGFYPIK